MVQNGTNIIALDTHQHKLEFGGDTIMIELGQWLKHSSFRKNHAEHRVDVLNPPFLVTAHRVTIVNAGPLYAVRIRFQALRGAEFSAPISQNDRKYRNEFISSAQGFLQQFKHMPDSTGGAAVHEIGQK